jgi:hypothetical protein
MCFIQVAISTCRDHSVVPLDGGQIPIFHSQRTSAAGQESGSRPTPSLLPRSFIRSPSPPSSRLGNNSACVIIGVTTWRQSCGRAKCLLGASAGSAA